MIRFQYQNVLKMLLINGTNLNLNVPINYNPGHNILELYNILVKIRFTTSKTKLDIQHSKLGTRVASRVPERLQDTHREKAPSNKTPTLSKIMNMNIWVADTSNQLLIRGS